MLPKARLVFLIPARPDPSVYLRFQNPPLFFTTLWLHKPLMQGKVYNIIYYTDSKALRDVTRPTHLCRGALVEMPSTMYVCVPKEPRIASLNMHSPRLCRQLFSRLLVSLTNSCFHLKYQPPSADKYQIHTMVFAPQSLHPHFSEYLEPQAQTPSPHPHHRAFLVSLCPQVLSALSLTLQ